MTYLIMSTNVITYYVNIAKIIVGCQPNNIWFLRIKVKHLTIFVREKIAQHILRYSPPCTW